MEQAERVHELPRRSLLGKRRCRCRGVNNEVADDVAYLEGVVAVAMRGRERCISGLITALAFQASGKARKAHLSAHLPRAAISGVEALVGAIGSEHEEQAEDRSRELEGRQWQR